MAQQQVQRHSSRKVFMTSSTAYQNFVNSLKSPFTKKQYIGSLQMYMDFCDVAAPEELLVGEPKAVQQKIIDYIVYLREVKRVSFASRQVHSCAMKRYYDMNDVILNWKKINAYLGEKTRTVKDRAYSRQEIAQLLEKCDERKRVIILLLASTGVRIGALPELKLKHLKKIEQYNLYQLTVYDNTPYEYVTFSTPECAKAIDGYLEYRQRYGEKLNPECPLIREQFDVIDPFHCVSPRHLTEEGIRHMIGRLAIDAGLRKRVALTDQGGISHRKEVMLNHGFRKYFNTLLVRAGVKAINKERLLGHRTGLEDSYYKPEDSELLQDYLKGINELTINNEDRLQIENQRVKERNNELEESQSEVAKMRKELEPLLELKKTLIKEGILKVN